MYIKKWKTAKNGSSKAPRRMVAHAFVHLLMHIYVCCCSWDGVCVFLLVY